MHLFFARAIPCCVSNRNAEFGRCRSPSWLDGLKADEVVPMFFRMGRDNAALRDIVGSRPQLLHPLCRTGSAGFSRQEPFAPAVTARYRRTYWFDEKGWRDSE